MHFEPGDLLLFYGRDLSSRVIEWATRGPSHVGIICPHALVTAVPGMVPRISGAASPLFRPGVLRQDRRQTHTPHPDPLPQRGEGEWRPGVMGEERRETLAPHSGAVSSAGPQTGEGERRTAGDGGSLLLFESTTLCDEPCLLTGRCVQGVQAHGPVERIAGYHGAVARLRLARAWRLNAHEIGILHEWLLNVASEPYDLRGALVSGTRLFKWSALMPYPDLESLFCSELCAAALMRLHRMPLENPSAYNPASLVRVLRRCGTYGAPRWLKRTEERRERSEERTDLASGGR
ncbi:MAG TPA: hypothetical protein VGM05_19780 [Planctomycetaceae bacterium]